jgi:hypothetical protein
LPFLQLLFDDLSLSAVEGCTKGKSMHHHGGSYYISTACKSCIPLVEQASMQSINDPNVLL